MAAPVIGDPSICRGHSEGTREGPRLGVGDVEEVNALESRGISDLGVSVERPDFREVIGEGEGCGQGGQGDEGGEEEQELGFHWWLGWLVLIDF